MESNDVTWGFSENYLNFDSEFLLTPSAIQRREHENENMQRMLDPCNPDNFWGSNLRFDSRFAFLLATQAY